MSQAARGLAESKHIVLVNEHGEEFHVSDVLNVSESRRLDGQPGEYAQVTLLLKRRSMAKLQGVRALKLQNRRLRDENEMLRASLELLTAGVEES